MAGILSRVLGPLFLAALAFLAVGCWDNWEINERGLVLAIGVDDIPVTDVTGAPGVEGSLIREQVGQALAVTYQFAIPAGLAGDENSGNGPTHYNLTTTAPSSELLIRGLAATRSSRKGDLVHLQVLILGPDLVKRDIFPVLERLARDPDVRKQVAVYVTENDVAQLMAINSQQEPMPAIYLAGLMKNQDWSHRIAPEMRLGMIYRAIREEAVFVVPRITAGKGDAKLAGGGVFHRGRLVAWLGEEEVTAFRWITGKIETVPVLVYVPQDEGKGLLDGYLARRSRVMVHPTMEEDQLKISLRVETEGSLLERQWEDRPLTDQDVKELQIALAQALAGDLSQLIDKAQQEWRLDIFGFDRFVEKKYPKVWAAIKEGWHEIYFPNIPVDIDVNLSITKTGTLK